VTDQAVWRGSETSTAGPLPPAEETFVWGAGENGVIGYYDPPTQVFLVGDTGVGGGMSDKVNTSEIRAQWASLIPLMMASAARGRTWGIGLRRAIIDRIKDISMLCEEVDSLRATLAAAHAAYQRGAERFRAAHPEYVERRMWPDKGEMVTWLLEQLAEADDTLVDVMGQACWQGDRYDTMCLSAYEGAAEYLVQAGRFVDCNAEPKEGERGKVMRFYKDAPEVER